jgi:DNA-binding NtrC family response regulator
MRSVFVMNEPRHCAPPRVLIADDREDVRTAGRFLLEDEGFSVESVASPEEVLDCVRRRLFDVVLLDLNYTRDTTSGKEGLTLVEGVRELDKELSIVVMTAWANCDLAVEAMQRGARDFVKKPWENDRLVSIARNQAAYCRSLREKRLLEEENRYLRGDTGSGLVARSKAMRNALEIIAAVGPIRP